MQIVPPGGSLIQPRAKAHTVINPKSPAKPIRIQLLRDCVIWQGALGKKNDVLEFDANTPEGYEAASLLVGSTSGKKVPISTPLFDSPPPLPEPPLSEKFLSLVDSGLNGLADLAEELQTTKGKIAACAQALIHDGTISLNTDGLYVRTSTAKKK